MRVRRLSSILIAAALVPVLFVGTSLGDSDPDATISAGPANGSTVYLTQTPSFSFSGNGDTASFECRVDGAAFAACSSPFTTPVLSNGAHSFEVRGLDSTGTPEVTPDTRNFSVNYSSVAYVESGVIKYFAISGQTNNLWASPTTGAYSVIDTSATLAAGPGCSQVNTGQVNCSSAGVTSMEISAGDGNDSITTNTVYGYTFTLPQTWDGGPGDDTIKSGPTTGSNHLIGGDGNDTLYGTATRPDVMSGGDGTDTVTYQNLAAATVSIDGIANDGALAEGDDVQLDVENVTGSSSADTLVGSSGVNVLTGGSGNDTLDGGPGADTLTGGAGTDTVTYANRANPVQISNDANANDGESGEGDRVSADTEVLIGGTSNDTLTSYGNADRLDGHFGDDVLSGGANDFADYSRRTSRVVVTLDSTANDGDPLLNEHDNVIGTSGVYGGSGDDTITGNASYNVIYGQAGNDAISGLAGNDTFNGDGGDDTIDGGTGGDITYGGTGVDTADFSTRTSPLTITTSDNLANDGQAGEADNIRSDIEVVRGGSANDTISGSSAADTLDGGAGRDTLNGLAGNDTLLVRDGLHDDVVCGSGTDVVTADTFDVSNADCESIDSAVVIDTYFTSGPAAGSTLLLHPEFSNYVTSYAFEFDSGTELFECRVDAEPFAACVSPYVVPVLSVGSHEIQVRAVDSQGNPDPTPATRQVTVARNSVVYLDGDVVRYIAVAGENNNVTLSSGTVPSGLSSPPTTTGSIITDTATQPVAGPGCTVMSATQVGCPNYFAASVEISTGDGNDSVTAGTGLLAQTIDVGEGDDSLITTQSAPTRALFGGPGNDIIRGDKTTSEVVSGGGGIDTVEYTYLYFAGVSVSLDGLDNDGLFGYETDNVMTDVENVVGTGYGDTLDGSDFDNVLTGGSGDDTISGGAGVDTVNGDGGNDTLLVRDGVQDTLSCGANADIVNADFVDSLGVAGQCETVSLPPTATIDSGPANGAVVTTSIVEFSFSTTGPAQTECSLDSAAFATCVSPLTIGPLSAGQHTFSVRALDQFGNVDPTPPSRSFTVESTTPETTITSGPADGASTLDTTPTFTFSSDTGTAFECSMDGGAYSTCSSPHTTEILGDGAHSFSVRATLGEEVDPTAAVRNFTVDSETPIVTLTAPQGFTTDSTPAVQFSTYDVQGVIATDCAVDFGTPVPCSSGFELDPLSPGEHYVEVMAHDAAGNAGGAVGAFVVDETAPDVTVDGTALTIATNAELMSSLTIERDGTAYRVEDAVPLKAGAGCAQETIWVVMCEDGAPITAASVEVADLDDKVTVDPGVSLAFTIDGGTGDDEVTGSSGVDSIIGGDGADQIDGGGAADTVTAGAGDDTIDARDTLADTIDCGDGSDQSMSDQADILSGCETDTKSNVVANIGSLVPLGSGFVQYLAADGAVNSVSQTETAQTVDFHDSTSPLVAGPGCFQVNNSTVSCDRTDVENMWAKLGDGDDTISFQSSTTLSSQTLAGSGDDIITGGDGQDFYKDESGNDAFQGGAGSMDAVDYGLSDVGVSISLNGEADDGPPGAADNIAVDVERVYASDHSDTLLGSEGQELIYGGAGNDEIRGSAGSDTIDGEAGADQIFGGSGSDLAIGGRGADTVALGDADFDSARCGSGIDTVVSDAQDQSQDCEQVNLRPEPSFDRKPDETISENHTTIEFSRDGAEGFECSLDGEQFTTCSSPYALSGLADGDHYFAVAATSIDGEVEALPTSPALIYFSVDTSGAPVSFVSSVTADDGVLSYKSGRDQSDNVTVLEDNGSFVFSQDDHFLQAGNGCSQHSDNEVRCQAAGNSKIEMYGYDGNDVLRSNAALNTELYGGDGDDILEGGTGDDVLIGGIGSDSVDYSKSAAGVVVDLNLTGSQFIVGSGTDTLSQIEGVTGSEFADELHAQDGGSSIHGGEGDDEIHGSLGNDLVFGGRGNDLMLGEAGSDSLHGEQGNDQIFGGEDGDLVDLGDGTDTAEGGYGDDYLVSSDAFADTVACGDGSDYLVSDYLDSVTDCDSEYRPVDTFVSADSLDENGVTNRASVNFSLSSTVSPATYECSIDGRDFFACETPVSTGFLTRGKHVFMARASNEGGVDAEAAILEFDVAYGGAVTLNNGLLTIEAADESEDDFEISQSGSQLIVSNSDQPGNLGLVASSPCVESTYTTVSCPLAEIETASVSAGDGDDLVVADTGVRLLVAGGDGDDDLSGSSATTRLVGGSGSDTFRSIGSGPTVDYSARSESVSLTLDDVPNDGSPSENDNILIASGKLVGGAGDDELIGSDDNDLIEGGPGQDSISGLAGEDEILATDGLPDVVDCGGSADSAVIDLQDVDIVNCEITEIATTTAIVGGVSEAQETNDSTPSFTFENASATGFECRMDDEAPAPCTSPWTTAELDDDEHQFEVIAYANGEALDDVGARRSFVVDTTPPEAQILSPVSGETTGSTPTLEFAADPEALVSCFLDGEAIASCEASQPLATLLSDGAHTLRIAAVDELGNSTENADEVDFEVDSTLPETVVESSIDDGGLTTGEDVVVLFQQDAAESLVFECALDAGEFEPCDSPWEPTLQEGQRNVSARAVSEAGAPDPTPWQVSVTVDRSIPELEFTSSPTPGEHVRSENVSVSFSAKRHSGFECRVDSNTYEPCSSPYSPTVGEEGVHTISVRALTESGPSSAAPIETSFVVDNSPPEVVETWGVENEVFTSNPVFELAASEPDSSFECAIDQHYSWDNTTLGSCDFLSDEWYWWGDASYRLSVVAIDHAGNRSTRAFHEFTVAKEGPPAGDDIAPFISITSVLPRVVLGIANYSESTVSFEFTASESATFSCAIDSASYEPCQSGVEFDGLEDGLHSFSVCSEDSNGNSGCWIGAVSFSVDTEMPAAPILLEKPTDGDTGDLATFRFEPAADPVFVRLDSGEWLPVENSHTFQGLAAGAHTLQFKAVDTAGNESVESEYTWNSIAPQSGPYYEMQVASPSPGSSYLVWPGPTEAGADVDVDTYRIRTCEHPRAETCTEPGSSSYAWTDWEEYDPGEMRSDGVHHSALTPVEEVASDAATIVSYEVETVFSDGTGGVVRSFAAGPWPLELEQTASLRDANGGQLNPDYISEGEDVHAAVDVDLGVGGSGVRRVGVFCNDQIDSFHNGMPSRRRQCANYSTESGLEAAISQIQGYYEDGAEIAPRVLEVHELACGLGPDEFGESVLTCPQRWDGELEIPAGSLLERSDFAPSLKFFVELTNGQVQILDQVRFEMPIVDSTPPDQPTDLEVGVDPDDSEGGGLIYADWSGVGDPVGSDHEAEGSGITKFAIQVRVNGGEWSEEIMQSAENEWSYLKDQSGLSAGDEVELKISSIDYVGHRSDPVFGSAVAAADAAGAEDDNPAPGAAMENGVAVASTADGEPRMNIYASWDPPGDLRYTLITLKSALYPSNVNTASPGEPLYWAPERSCANAKSCAKDSTSSYRVGMYRVRTTVTIGSSETPINTFWSHSTSLEPLDGSFNSPAVPGDGEIVDTAGVSIDETDSLADETAEVESEDNGATISRKKPKMPARFKSCFPKPGKSGKRDLSKKPGKADFDVDSKGAPWQHVCRLAYKLVKSDEVGKKRNDYVADKTRDAYALKGSRQYPTSLKGSYMKTITLQDETGTTTGIHAWPMLDSLGNTRAWIASRKIGKARYWQLYHVSDPKNAYVADSMTRLKVDKKHLRAAKLQGRACYRPLKGEKLYGPAASKRLKLTNSTVSLFKVDLGAPVDRVRFFVPNKAFNASAKSLHKTKVGCQTVSSKASQQYKRTPFEIPDTETTYQEPDELNKTRIQKLFVFKESPSGGQEAGKTYATYNVKTKYDTAYVFVNTNSVSQGGVVRGLFPLKDIGMRLIGFTGYCDVNAYTKTTTTPLKINGADLTDAQQEQQKSVTLRKQDGMQWAYGQLTTNKRRTGLYGWLPLASLGITDPPGAPGSQDCNYGPAH